MSKGSSKSSSSTENIATNQQVASTEGSIAAGAGASITIETLDADLAQRAISEIGDTADSAIESVTNTVRSTASDALDFGDTSLARAFEFATTTTRAENARNENFLNFARSQGELVAASRGVENPDTSRYVIYALGVAVIIAVSLALKRGK